MLWLEEPTSLTSRTYDGPLPATFPRALTLTKAIGAHFDHMRVHLLTNGQGLWLGELTVYNMAGWFQDCGHQPNASLTLATHKTEFRWVLLLL